mmetsp:Transcript_42024/g.68171  ORF Transcript_42024/g.68171 Transcript_42024/m.68171 type:complete len:1040 (+) Transcript_42024:107-3226(+)
MTATSLISPVRGTREKSKSLSELETLLRLSPGALWTYYIDLSNRVDAKLMSPICKVLTSRPIWTELDLSNNTKIGDPGVAQIALALAGNQMITRLDLSSTGMGDSGAQALASVLNESNVLYVLNLRNNSISDSGARAFADTLKSGSCKLAALALDANDIRTNGALALADAVQRGHKPLHTLLLHDNAVGVEGVRSIADALRHNFCITKLTVSLPQDSSSNPRRPEESDLLRQINECLKANALIREVERKALYGALLDTVFSSSSFSSDTSNPESSSSSSTTTANVNANGVAVVPNPMSASNQKMSQKELLRALSYFVAHGNVRVVEGLLSNAIISDVDTVTDDGPPIHIAVRNGHIPLLQLLIDKRADVNIEWNGRRPVLEAVTRGSVQAVRMLVEANGDCRCRDETASTPLHIACANGLQQIVDILVKDGNAFLDGFNHAGDTPLLLAVRNDFAGIVHILLENNANPNLTDRAGNTALHIAIMNGNEEMAKALLAHAANLDIRNQDDKLPLDMTDSEKFRFALKQLAGVRDVFISYAHQPASNAAFARRLRDALQQQRITVWIDETKATGINAGAEWRAEIVEGIKDAAAFVYVVTANSVQSEWCRKELALAKSLRKPIFPLWREMTFVDTEVEEQLSSKQFVDFTRDDMFSDSLQMLISGLQDAIFLAKASTSASAADSDNEQAEQQAKRPNTADSNRPPSTIPSSRPSMSPRIALDLGDSVYDVVICHGNQHGVFAGKMKERFVEMGLRCYVERSKSSPSPAMGSASANEVDADISWAIANCVVFLPIFSESTVLSHVLKDQVALAENRGRRIHPILLSGMRFPLSLQFSFANCQTFSFSETFNFESDFREVYRSIQPDVLRAYEERPPNSTDSFTASIHALELIRRDAKAQVAMLQQRIADCTTRISYFTNLSLSTKSNPISSSSTSTSSPRASPRQPNPSPARTRMPAPGSHGMLTLPSPSPSSMNPLVTHAALDIETSMESVMSMSASMSSSSSSASLPPLSWNASSLPTPMSSRSTALTSGALGDFLGDGCA